METNETTKTDKTEAADKKKEAKAKAASAAAADDGKAKGKTAPAKDAAKGAAPAEEPKESYKFEEVVTDKTPRVPIGKIKVPEFDSRVKRAEPDEALLASIAEEGIRTPLLVAPIGDGDYVLIAGRRRLAAAVKLGHKEVPIAPQEFKGDKDSGLTPMSQAKMACFGENFHRKDLNAFDLAAMMRDLKENEGFTQSQIAKRIHKGEAFVSQYLGIFALDKRVQNLLRQHAESEGIISKARTLKQVDDPDVQFEIATSAFDRKAGFWSTEMLASQVALAVERAERAKMRAEEKAKAAKNKKKGDDGAAEGGGDDEGDDEIRSPFADAKVTAKATEVRAYGELVNVAYVKRMDALRAAAAESTSSEELLKLATALPKEKKTALEEGLTKLEARHEAEVKAAFEKGRMEALKSLTGLKQLPKGIRAD